MKIIFKIAGTELRTLFYSPIAWFLMIVFLIQCGVTYFDVIEMITRQQEIGGDSYRFWSSVTNYVFLNPYMGLFGKIMQNLYLYIPLLTMSLISRELSSGTIKLLYSSPIRVYEIVFGKYLAMLGYSLILVAIMAVFLTAGIVDIEHPQTSMLWSALFGFFLLLCAYSAIGLFMSSLTSYQVVAAISTFVVIGFLSQIGRFWQDVAFVRELTYFLSINGRTQKMLAGLIASKDIIYFVVIVYLFLGFTIFRIKSGMESISLIKRLGRYLVLVVTALTVGYVSSMPSLVHYTDVTFDKSRTLTPRVQEVIKGFGDDPVEVTAYANLINRYFEYGGPSSYNANLSRWEPYMRFMPNMKLETVMYYDTVEAQLLPPNLRGKSMKEAAEQNAKGKDINLEDVLTPEQIRARINLSDESNRFVMQLKWRDRATFLRVYDDLMVWPSETEIAAALLRLQQAALPKIGFVVGQMERDIDKSGDRDYKTLVNLPTFRYSLVNQGFDVQTVLLEEGPIPTDLAALVIADPRVALSASSLQQLQEYIDNGGNIMIAGEPGRQDILKPLLEQIGVSLGDGLIIQESRNDVPEHALAYVQPVAGSFYKPLERAVEDSSRLTMPSSTDLLYRQDLGFNVMPLAMTDGKSAWMRTRPIDLEVKVNARVSFSGPEPKAEFDTGGARGMQADRGRTSRDSLGTVTYEAAAGDVMKKMATVIGLSRTLNGKEQRIVVASDADFISNKELSRQRTANFQFSTTLFSWISGGDFPIDTSRPEAKDRRLTHTLDAMKTKKIVYLWVVPGCLLALGAILLLRRKRR